jgi:hypothetical protein
MSFLWSGQDPENIKGGHCLVNWQVCTRPRKLGGLGIKDLDKFGRALRLRWLWHNWDQVDKPWKHLIKVFDHSDRQLFFSSTLIMVGNGRDTPFWEGRWLHGKAPKELAPNLYKVYRWKKKDQSGLNFVMIIGLQTFQGSPLPIRSKNSLYCLWPSHLSSLQIRKTRFSGDGARMVNIL